MRLLASRHLGTTRSQAPAWKRTALEAPASRVNVSRQLGGSLQFMGFPGRAWEPAVDKPAMAIAEKCLF